MITIALRMARHRITSLIAVACAVLGGAALVTATGVLAESGLSSHAPLGRLAGADIVVTAQQSVPVPEDLDAALPERRRIDSSVADDLAGVPGVRRAVADVSFPASLLGRDDRPVDLGDPAVAAHNWSAAHLLGDRRTDGRAPTGTDEIALGATAAARADAAVGDTVRVVAAGRPQQEYRVSGVLPGGGDELYLSDSAAATLVSDGTGQGSPQADLIGLQVEKGSTGSVAAAVEKTLRGTDLVVSTGAARGDTTAPDVTAARGLLLIVAASFAGTVAMLVAFVLAGAVTVSVAGRRRELALIRSIGGTPAQVRGLVANETAIVAALSALPGIALGYAITGQLADLLRSVGILPDSLPLTVGPLPGLAALVTMVVAAYIAAQAASRRTSRMTSTQAMVESATEARRPSRVRGWVGLGLLAASFVISVGPLVMPDENGAAATASVGILAAIGLAVCAPMLLGRVVEAFAGRVRTGASAPTWLAVANLRVFSRRFSGVMAASAMLMIFTLTYALSQTTLIRAMEDTARDGTMAQLSVTGGALGGVPNDVLADIRAADGVQAAAPVSTTSVAWTHRTLGDEATEPESAMILTPQASKVLDLDVQHGSLRGLTGNTVAVGSDVASSRDAEVGKVVRMALGDGTDVKAQVVAVYGRQLGFGSIVLSRDLALQHTTSRLDQGILVRADDMDRATRSLAALTASHPGLAVEDVAHPDGPSATTQSLALNAATLVVLLGYLTLTIANRIVAMTTQRRGEISAIRFAGATRRQVLAMTRREALMTATVASVGALVVAAVPLLFLSIGFLERPWPAGPVWLLPATVLLVFAIILGSVELPTRHLLRSSPTQTGR
ncbi:FtsX-like permease family protein [Aeromicrobium wangtongii]|uniref:FtsX-like permease family protein n=1 Tax=Aeromicrobium wangtongii TaxID=2969247 RepID=A0ABY5M3W2_9ACTN|nr:FtsX-like permease family protein [Aeromicrobium wangtongii]MCD9199106.1 FtsX-like permease family protein [Aeromicrobium wangtongii]UUP12863.1 FtsX-like permease family protein [Aeromicrobium wangtongii]